VADAGRRCDVHQHVWPVAFIAALRRRDEPPYLRGWTLFTAGERPYEIDPAAHDAAARAALDPDTRILLSPSTPLGIEALPPAEAVGLLDAWHEGVLALGEPFGGWAAVAEQDPDVDGLIELFDRGLVGLQISATVLDTPAAVEKAAPLLHACEQHDRPVLVHPGPTRAHDVPSWWAAVVGYTAQVQAAWWAWHTVGRELLPDLRICFAAGAGLAPLQHERFSARGGGRFAVDPGVFVDTSSCGRQAVDALTRVLGVDALVLGSDRPYAEPIDIDLGDAARRAITVTNPTRLAEGGRA
jgi:hypothetical protein